MFDHPNTQPVTPANTGESFTICNHSQEADTVYMPGWSLLSQTEKEVFFRFAKNKVIEEKAKNGDQSATVEVQHQIDRRKKAEEKNHLTNEIRQQGQILKSQLFNVIYATRDKKIITFCNIIDLLGVLIYETITQNEPRTIYYWIISEAEKIISDAHMQNARSGYKK